MEGGRVINTVSLYAQGFILDKERLNPLDCFLDERIRSNEYDLGSGCVCLFCFC